MAEATADIRPSDDVGYRYAVLITMAMAAMLYSLTITIVNIALPQLQGALSASQDQISWVVTLNVVATAVATPLTGSLVARLGQKRLLIWCVIGFTISSLACAAVNSLSAILFLRVLQGVFGAPLVPLAQAIILQTWPRELHAKANGYMGFSVVIGPAIAPTLGGYLAEEYNWRWIFLLIVPLGVAVFFGILAYIKEGGKTGRVRFDALGFALFSIVIVSLQLILDRGERMDWYDSGFILSLTVIMGLAAYMYVANSWFVEEPFINPRLFTSRNYVIGLILVFIYGSLNFTPLVLLPSLLQNLKGYPDTLIGIVLAARGVGMVIGFWVAARMGRLDPRVGLSLGMLCVGVSGWGLAVIDLDVGLWELSRVGILQGFGCGLMWVPLSVVAFSTLPPKMLPDGAALFHLLRNLGTSLYVALSVFLLVRTSRISYAEMTETVTVFSDRLFFPSDTGTAAVAWIDSLPFLASEVGRQSAMIGYNNCFYFYAATCLATIPLLLAVRSKQG